MKTQLDHVYELERTRPDALWLTQPMGADAFGSSATPKR